MTADELIAALDAKFPKWELWRTADKEWACRAFHGDEVQGATTLSLALQCLLEYKPLPRVPRRPTLLSLDLFTARRNGSYWNLFYDGRDWSYRHKTKKEAMQCAEKLCDASSKRCAEWADKYGELVARGKEGIDYRWED
jgi:hypothetical protein